MERGDGMKIYREIGSMHLVLQCDKEGYFRPVYEIEVDEAEPIKHGRWLTDGYDYRCSQCGLYVGGGDIPKTMKYCPNCGAKMDEVTK